MSSHSELSPGARVTAFRFSISQRLAAPFFTTLDLMAACAGVALLLSQLVDRYFWTADLANFFRPHLFGAAILWLLITLPLRRSRSILIACAVTAICGFPLFNEPPRAEPAHGIRFTLTSINLFNENFNAGGFQSFIETERPDIIITQETTAFWQNVIQGLSGYQYESSGNVRSNDDLKLVSKYPIVSETKIIGGAAYKALKRHPVRFEIGLPGSQRGPLVVYAIHTKTPRRKQQWDQRNLYLSLLAETLENEKPGTAIVVAGDWNTPTWSPFYRDFFDRTGLLSTERPIWPQPTRFSIRFGSVVFLGTPIDHIAVSRNIGLDNLRTGPKFGSNHVPVIASLSLCVDRTCR